MVLDPGSSGAARAATPSGPSGSQEWVWLARILRPQGRKGEVFAEVLTDFPEKFTERKQLWLLASASSAKSISPSFAKPIESSSSKSTGPSSAMSGFVTGHDFSRAENAAKKSGALAPAVISLPREVELLHHWPHKGGIVLHFAGIDSITAAETLKGLTVAIPRAARAPLADDEVYIGDLIGCALFDVAPATPLLVGEIEEVDRSAGPVALLVVNGASGEVLIPFAKSYLRSIDIEARRVEMALPEGLVELNAPGKTP